MNEFYTERRFFADASKEVNVDVCMFVNHILRHFGIEFISEHFLARLENNELSVQLQVQCAFLKDFANESAGVVTEDDYAIALFCVEHTFESVLGCLSGIHFLTRGIIGWFSAISFQPKPSDGKRRNNLVPLINSKKTEN